MNALPAPPFATFQTTVDRGPWTIRIFPLDDGRAKPIFETDDGFLPQSKWIVGFRASDELSSISLLGGTRIISSMALFNPTWYGAYLWLRHGFLATLSGGGSTPRPAPSRDAALLRAALDAYTEVYDEEDAAGRNRLNRALVAAIGSRPRLYRLGPGGKGSRWHSPVVLRWPEIAALGASGALARGLAALMHPSKRQR